MSAIHDRLKSIGAFPGVIQIVPTVGDHELLTDPADIGSGAVGALTNHGGPVIVGGRVALIYVDSFPDNEADFTAFAKAIVENGYYGSPDGKDKSNSVFAGAFHLSLGITGTISDAQCQALVQAHLGKELPANDGQTLYTLIMPPTLQVTEGGQSSCSAFCGYHSGFALGSALCYYSVICDASCSGCHGNFTPQQARQMVFSHEYGEWRSDPNGQGWFSDATGMENGDECAWNLVAWGPNNQWAVQPLAAMVNGAWTCQTLPYQAPSQPGPGPGPGPQPQPAKMDAEFARELKLIAAQSPVPGHPDWWTAMAQGVAWSQQLQDAIAARGATPAAAPPPPLPAV